jgi:hypothetical protein
VVEQMQAVAGFATIDTLPQAGEPPVLSVGRFARNERTGENFFISKVSRSSASLGGRPTVVLIHVKPLSSSQRTHLFLHCDWAVLASRPKVPSTFAAAALCCEISLCDHDCPVCGRAPDGGVRCRCSFPLGLPRGPLDYSQFRPNGAYSFVGRYSGLSSLYLRSGEMPDAPLQRVLASLAMTATSVPEPEYDALASSLQMLAIQERMGQPSVPRGVPTLSANVVASLDDRGPSSFGNVPVICDSATATSAEVVAARVEPVGPLRDADLTSCYALQLATTMQAEAAELCVIGLPLQQPALASGALSVFGEDPAAFLMDGADDFLIRPVREDDSSPVSSDDMLPASVREAVPQARRDPLEGSAISRAPTFDAHQGRLQPQAPLDPVAAAKLERQLERQRKNRLAAARSNARRKERRETLERSLRESHALKEELQQRYAAALARNTELKERAAEIWVSKMKTVRSEFGH